MSTSDSWPVSNVSLTADSVPGPEACFRAIWDFGMTAGLIKRWGVFDRSWPIDRRCWDEYRMTGNFTGTLTELRTTLYVTLRALRFCEDMTPNSTEEDDIRALVATIRQKVESDSRD